MEYLFTFAHTRVSQVLPVIWLLDRGKGTVQYIKKKVVAYQPPQGDHWNIQSTVQGMANISFLPIESLDNKKRLDLLKAIMLGSRFVRCVYIDVGKRDYNYLSKVYDLIYKDILHGKEKLIFKFFVVMSKAEFSFNWLIQLMKRRNLK